MAPVVLEASAPSPTVLADDEALQLPPPPASSSPALPTTSAPCMQCAHSKQ